ncbi:hypothetical protein [Amycolatopsis kentuckyensis]|uniref:hypothetical protein n=1 Tax=Amycolatopsis kentuckyensis TaxID=218823 RepID=UPI003567D276
MTADPEFAARDLLRRLHLLIAGYPVERHRVEIMAALPDVPEHVLCRAWDLQATVLLAPEIYVAVVRACGGDDAAVGRMFVLYVRAVLARDAVEAGGPAGTDDRLDPARIDLALTVPAVPAARPEPLVASGPRAAARSSVDQPTVPRLRLPPSGLGLPPELQEIGTQAQFANYLKTLIAESGLTLRQVEKATKEHDETAVTCRSTLSDAFGRGTVPKNERTLEVLLTVLISQVTGRDAGGAMVRRRVAEALQVWHRVLRVRPENAPVLVAGRANGCPPVCDAVLDELTRATRAAIAEGSPDAAGLARAQRILRGIG